MGVMKQDHLARMERECVVCGDQSEGERTEKDCGRCGQPEKLCASCAEEAGPNRLCDYCTHVMESDS